MSAGDSLICIGCPVGCRLRIRRDGDTVDVKGAGCDRGREYAEAEVVRPERVFTGTVRVSGGSRCVVAVQSAGPVPRDLLPMVAREVALTCASAPVSPGDPLLTAAGVSIVATAAVDTASA